MLQELISPSLGGKNSRVPLQPEEVRSLRSKSPRYVVPKSTHHVKIVAVEVLIVSSLNLDLLRIVSIDQDLHGGDT
jgi:hypothetical protein